MSFRDILSECAEKAQQPSTESRPQETPAPKPAGRILCFPAHDEADEIAALMLAQLLDQAGWETVAFPLDSSLQSMLDMVQPVSTDVFCISSIPPFSLAHARTLAWEIRVRFPQGNILIGMWGFNGDSKRALKRFEPVHPDKLVTSLKSALEYLIPPVPA